MRFFFKSLGGAALLLIAYLLFWPVPIDPAAWTPPQTVGWTGDYAENTALAATEWLGHDVGFGPEDVAVDEHGFIYVGYDDGRLVKFAPDGTQPTLLADTGGRPFGLAFDAAHNLIVADGDRGLLAVDSVGAITVLTTTADNQPFGFADDLDIAADGTIYFSDASSRHRNYRHDLLEHRPNGRLLAYDPQTQATRTVLHDLYFANGIAVSPDQSFVLVVETGRYAVTRYWLAGEKAGTHEPFIENLPAFPDGISSDGAGLFWIALVSPRDPKLDALLPHPFWRKVLLRLPTFLQPDVQRYGMVLGVDANGHVVHNLQDPSPDSFSPISSVEAVGDYLYLGSLTTPAFGRIARPKIN